jgi:phosphoribosylamine-glycine ligase
MGVVAGAPLGGISAVDEQDTYGLVRSLLTPLKPWFQEVRYHGPIQVTAAFHENTWKVLEYNVRIGITNGPMILHMLENPLEVITAVSRNKPPIIKFRPSIRYGCSITLAGYGYPYISLTGPRLPITCSERELEGLLWNEVAEEPDGTLVMTGHRIADIVSFSAQLDDAIAQSYQKIKTLKCLASYYRTDIGQSLWPPGNE